MLRCFGRSLSSERGQARARRSPARWSYVNVRPFALCVSQVVLILRPARSPHSRIPIVALQSSHHSKNATGITCKKCSCVRGVH